MALFGLLKDGTKPGGLSGNDKLALLLSGVSDTFAQNAGQSGGAMDALTKSLADRHEKARKEKAMADFASAIPGLLGGGAPAAAPVGPITQGPGLDGAPTANSTLPPPAPPPPQLQQIVKGFLPYMVNPETAPMASSMVGLIKMLQPEKPQRIEGPDGIYEIDDQGHSKLIQKYPAKPNTTPGQVNPITGRWEWAPGYLDAQENKATALRKVIVNNPLPQRGRAGGGRGRGGGPVPPLPAGFVMEK